MISLKTNHFMIVIDDWKLLCRARFRVFPLQKKKWVIAVKQKVFDTAFQAIYSLKQDENHFWR